MPILLALQSNSTGSVLINDDTLGGGIRELKFGVAAPGTGDYLLVTWLHTFKYYYWNRNICLSNFVQKE